MTINLLRATIRAIRADSAYIETPNAVTREVRCKALDKLDAAAGWSVASDMLARIDFNIDVAAEFNLTHHDFIFYATHSDTLVEAVANVRKYDSPPSFLRAA